LRCRAVLNKGCQSVIAGFQEEQGNVLTETVNKKNVVRKVTVTMW
jgi:hypothetical protein